VNSIGLSVQQNLSQGKIDILLFSNFAHFETSQQIKIATG
jgi:hypothetical protein